MVRYTDTCAQIEKHFADLNISTDKPGFYNKPNFISVETAEPIFLNNYARFIDCREYSQDYLDYAERRIREIVTALHPEVLEGPKGACMSGSSVLMKILEREGIWCYQLKGTLTISFPVQSRLPTQHFYSVVAPGESGQIPAAHSWLVAPPYKVVDITVKHQGYSDPAMLEYLPDVILEKTSNVPPVFTTEICSPAAIDYYSRQGFSKKEVHFKAAPELRNFFPLFPANKFRMNGVDFKYIPMALMAPDEPLEECRMYPDGRTGDLIYKDRIEQGSPPLGPPPQ